jgi:hypothetical protein
MEVKGTAAKSIPDFVGRKYKDRYFEWLNALPEKSRKIMMDGLKTNLWYPIEDAAIMPTQMIGEVFYGGDIQKGAWECGKYSAEVALKGIYKVYVKLSKPEHIIDRASRIFSAYYQPSEMSVSDKGKNFVQLSVTKFPTPSVVIDYRIAGWMQTAMEISGCNDVKVEITKSLAKGGRETTFHVSWS